MKNQRGITLVVLIITIIVMLIFVTVAINTGTESYEYMKLTKFIAYMQNLQKKVDLIVESNEKYLQIGRELTRAQKSKLEEILRSDGYAFETNDIENVNLRYFNKQAIEEDLDLNNINDEIIVNFETREVISLNGVEYQGKIKHTQYDLSGGQTLVENVALNRTLTQNSIVITKQIDGLNAQITITIDENYGISNGTLTYKLEDGQGTMITNATQKGGSYTFNTSVSGEYTIKLTDNINKNSYIGKTVNLRLTNSPKETEGKVLYNPQNYDYSDLDSTKWAYATYDNNGITEYYVWIPRFAYNSRNTQEIEFIRGNSNITTADTYVHSLWTIPQAFSTSTKELTGVWIQLDSAPKEGLNIVNILED